jgi:hypothetical protein
MELDLVVMQLWYTMKHSSYGGPSASLKSLRTRNGIRPLFREFSHGFIGRCKGDRSNRLYPKKRHKRGKSTWIMTKQAEV